MNVKKIGAGLAALAATSLGLAAVPAFADTDTVVLGPPPTASAPSSTDT